MSYRTTIPNAVIRPLLIAELGKLEENDFDPNPLPRGALMGRANGKNVCRTTPLQQVAWQSGLALRTVWEILYGKRKTATFASVDKLISSWLGRPDLWQQPPLDRYYREH